MKAIPTILSAAVTAAFSISAAAQQAPAPGAGGERAGQPTAQAAPGQQETTTVHATVQSVDRDKRLVTLRTGDGDTVQVRVGPQVRNFENLKQGDRVTARFTEALALSVAKGDDVTRQRVQSETVRQAPTGGKPGFEAEERVTVVAEVVEVDPGAGRVTVRASGGEPVRLRVRDREALRDVEKGDQIVANYVESMAVSIEAGSASSPTAGSTPQAAAAGTTTGGTATTAGAATAGAPAMATATADYSAPLQKLLQAAQELRESVQAMATQPAGDRRNQAIDRANTALLETQRAMIALPPELRSGTAARAGTDERQSVEQLQQASQQLREGIQQLAQRPPGPERNEAIRQANEALLETQQALLMVTAMPAGGATGAAAARQPATGPAATGTAGGTTGAAAGTTGPASGPATGPASGAAGTGTTDKPTGR